MPARITLTVTSGKLHGQRFVFDERTTCIVGRAGDCVPRLPGDDEHRVISRHHCLLDINPPDIRVRDFGSLNGTYINGQKIGQRWQGQNPEQAARLLFPEHDLKDGDEITLGRTVIRIGVTSVAVCRTCSCEIPAERLAESAVGPAVYQCHDCRLKEGSAPSVAANSSGSKSTVSGACTKCGRDVSHEIGSQRIGAYVCRACQESPMEILAELLSVARTGRKDLVSISGYLVEHELGRGGMGAVYLARHQKTGERVALKVMLPKIAAEEHSVRSFLRETENTRALHHPHVVELRQAGCSQGVFFLTLEYCDAGSVDKLMKQSGGKLTVVEAGPLILHVLEALEYAHQALIPSVKQKDGRYRPGRGLVHRDLKPHNILLTGSGSSRVAKIGDYGLSKAFDLAGLSGHTCTAAGSSHPTLGGSPAFVAREQVRNFKYARPDVDVWAAAASLYNMLTGAYPRDFSPRKDHWLTVLECDAVPILKRNPLIPKRLAEVIDAALKETPRIGFQSASEFRKALEPVL